VSVKKRFVGLALITLIAVVGWFVFAFRPAHSRLSELHAQVDKTQKQVADLEAQLRRLLALQRSEGELKAEATRMSTALPADPKVSDFIIQVQDAANSAGIDFLSISPSLPAEPVAVVTSPTSSAAPSQPSSSQQGGEQATQPSTSAPNPLRSISVQLKADGRYFEVEEFILRMEHLARAVKIDELTLGAAGQTQSGSAPGTIVSGSPAKSPDALSATLKLQMFMLMPQAAAGSAPTTQGAA
jgi:Tfp pilus assembly protein PilO